MDKKYSVNLCGIRVDNVSMAEAVGYIGGLVRARKPSYVITPNADHMVKLQKDELFRKVYADASLVLADGMALIWASHFLGTPFKEKVSGSDLMPELCRHAAEKGYKIFLMGGRPGAAEKAKMVLEGWYPGIRIVGACCPPLGFEKDEKENKKVCDSIRQAAPDILFVGLGAPKQEKWIYKHFEMLQIPVSVGVGVTFEFIAGIVPRAPKWMQRFGMEWSWRLAMEPTRLWHRYLVDDPLFFWMAFKQKFSK